MSQLSSEQHHLHLVNNDHLRVKEYEIGDEANCAAVAIIHLIRKLCFFSCDLNPFAVLFNVRLSPLFTLGTKPICRWRKFQTQSFTDQRVMSW